MDRPEKDPIFNSPKFGEAETLRGNKVSYISKKIDQLGSIIVDNPEAIPLGYDGDKIDNEKIVEGGSDLNNLPEMVRTIESGPVIHLGYDGEDKEIENEFDLAVHDFKKNDGLPKTEASEIPKIPVSEKSNEEEKKVFDKDSFRDEKNIDNFESDPEDISIPGGLESYPDDLNLAEFFRELQGNSTPEPALESVPSNLDEIMADWEKEMASGSGVESKEEKVEVVGEEFANTVRESFEDKKKEVTPNSRWSFVKERLRGAASLGLYEFSSATKLWWNTNRQGKKIKKASESLEEETSVTLNDNERILKQLEEMEIIDRETKEVFSGLTEDQINDCILYANRGAVLEKIEKNNLIQEKIIADSLTTFESKFKNTKTYRGQKIGAEKIKEIEEVLQAKLAGIRTGRVQKDLVAFNKLIREKVDAEWYKRYVAGGIEMALMSTLIVYIKPLVAKNLSLTAMKAGSSTVRKVAETVGKIKEVMPSIQNVPMPAPSAPNIGFELSGETPTVTEALPIEAQEDVVKMKKTVWHSVKDYLKLNGVKNPTDLQIMEASKLVAENNDIGVKDWGIEGKNLDTKLKAGFSLNMAGVGEMAVKWGGKKMTREAWKFIFETI